MAHWSSPPLVARLTAVATLGGLLFGYDTAVISGAVTAIDANFIDPLNLSETARSSLSGLTIASALIGCVVGAAVAGWIADAFGRKRALMLAAILFLIGSLGSAVPEIGLGTIGAMGAGALPPFAIYRILGGVGVGIASMISPLYIAEIAPKRTRGLLVSCNQMAIVIGMMLVYFVNWSVASLGDDAWLKSMGWRWMLASEAVPSLLFLGLLMLVPDSPRWMAMKHRDEQAYGILRRLDEAEARATLIEIKESLTARDGALFAFGKKVLVLGVMLSVFQQFVGINAVLYYAPVMFRNMGATTDGALLQTIVVGIANVAFTLMAILTVDRIGRRPLMIAGAMVMAIAMMALGFLFTLKITGAAAIVAVVLYIAGFAFSWGPVTWVLLSEIFPNPIKGKAMAIAVAAQWIANLAVSASFKVIDGNAFLVDRFNHGAAYWGYGVISVVAAAFVARYVPETKGRSLESIQGIWRKIPAAGFAPRAGVQM